jgi:hypothetical protein
MLAMKIPSKINSFNMRFVVILLFLLLLALNMKVVTTRLNNLPEKKKIFENIVQEKIFIPECNKNTCDSLGGILKFTELN